MGTAEPASPSVSLSSRGPDPASEDTSPHECCAGGPLNREVVALPRFRQKQALPSCHSDPSLSLPLKEAPGPQGASPSSQHVSVPSFYKDKYPVCTWKQQWRVLAFLVLSLIETVKQLRRLLTLTSGHRAGC